MNKTSLQNEPYADKFYLILRRSPKSISLLFNLRKASDEVTKEITCCLNGCIPDVAETAADVATKYGTVVLYKSYGVLFEVPFVRSVLR